MFKINTPRKKLAVIFIIIMIIPLVLYPYWNSIMSVVDRERIDLGPEEALAGQVTEFTVQVESDGGVVRLPPELLPVIDERVVTERNLTFSGSQFRFEALVPPTAGELNITVETERDTRKFTVSAAPGNEPVVSGQRIVEQMDYVTDPGNRMMRRVTAHPQLEIGARYFRDQFRSFGLDAEIVRYWLPTSGDNPRQRLMGVFIWNVVAYKWGENTKEWIVLGGHFDVAPGTLEGAYDNTGGTNSVVEIARGISQFETEKTIVFGLWAGEEEGLWGATKFTENIPNDVTVKTYLNFDMAGLNYPAPFDLSAIVGPDEDPDIIEQGSLLNLTNQSAHDILNYPRVTGVNVTENPFGRSDHVRFQQIGVPTVFFFGADDDEYSAYHSRDDTLDEMERVAGGRENLIGGFDTLAWTGFYLTVVLDNDDEVEQQR
jgi:hypothetical protein